MTFNYYALILFSLSYYALIDLAYIVNDNYGNVENYLMLIVKESPLHAYQKVEELPSAAVVSSDGAVVASVLWIVVVGLVVGSAVVVVNNKFNNSRL